MRTTNTQHQTANAQVKKIHRLRVGGYEEQRTRRGSETPPEVHSNH